MPNSAKQCQIRVCSATPRFSYAVPKTVICACPAVTEHGTAATLGTGYGRGAVRVGGGGGVIPTHPAGCSRRSQKHPAKRAPEGPAGPWSGWGAGPGDYMCSAAGTAPRYHPSGPVRTLVLPCTWDPQNAASGPIRRDFRSFPGNLVKTAECHPNSSKRPTIVPISKKRLQKSPLGFLRFPYCVAFSHKELMGHFDRATDLFVKMTKCRPYVHPMCMPRRGRRYPHDLRSKLLLEVAPHLLSAVPSGGILNGSVFKGFTRPWVINGFLGLA